MSSEPSLTHCVGAALSYGASSMSIILVNKVILYSYNFDSPSVMAFVHMCVSLAFVVLLKAVGLIKYKDFSVVNFKQFYPVSLCFVANIVAGLWVVKFVNVPMFTTLRRLPILFTLGLQWYFFQMRPKLRIVIPVFIILSGALIAGWGDLAYDPRGYSAAMINNLLTASYLVISKHVMCKLGTSEPLLPTTDKQPEQPTKVDVPQKENAPQASQTLSKFGVLFYNTLIAAPLLGIYCFYIGEFERTSLEFEYLFDHHFQLTFMASALLAFFINFTQLWCNEVNSPLTTGITGQTKNVLQAIIGGIIFADTEPTVLLVVGCLLSMFGGFLFFNEKYKMSRENKSKHVLRRA